MARNGEGSQGDDSLGHLAVDNKFITHGLDATDKSDPSIFAFVLALPA